MIDFENWLEDLEIQTLTEELKKEILKRVDDLHKDAYGEGYGDAKDTMYNHLENM